MILKELNLIGFGKYENKTMEFDNGINVIYGENETGKTTVHSFIDGMFYGFLKPSLKSTIYLEEHKKFEPWEAKQYSGIIKFYHKDKLYRIERDFTKGKEETKVFLENSGEEITNTIDNGSKGKVLQPGFHFFGFNSRLYSNTVSIKQLATKTDDKLADEVREKLINISTSLDEEISIDNAIKDLEKTLKDIGTVRAINSNYGTLSSKIISLEAEKKVIIDLKIDYEALLNNENDLNRRIESTNKDLENQNFELNKANYFQKKNIFNEAKELVGDLDSLNETISGVVIYKDLSQDDYNYANNLNNNLIIIDSNIANTTQQINELQMELDNIQNVSTEEEQQNLEQISDDYFNVESLEEDKNKLIYGQDNSLLEALKIDVDKNHRKNIVNLIALSVLSISYSLFNYLAWGSWMFVLLAQILLIPVVIIVRLLGKIRNTNLKLQSQLIEVKEKERQKKEQILEMEHSQTYILNKYELNSKIGLRKLYDEIKNKVYIINEQLNYIQEHKKKIGVLMDKNERLQEDKQIQIEEFVCILKKNNVSDLSSFEKGLKNKELYDDYLVAIKNKKDLLKRILGNFNLEQLQRELVETKIYDSNDCLPLEFINSSMEELRVVLTQDLIEKRGLEERINQIGPTISRLVEVEEELIRFKAKIGEYDKKIEAIQLAKLTIEDLSKDIHNQFAPEINKKVGDIVGEITGGKYNSVRINNSLDIGVINPNTGQIIDINSLSGGTIDQLYFSLRFGIINSMVESDLPLILDDCFIQYDDKRLENILRFLQKIGKDRQIILFSCHNRERKILENLDMKFNLITLS